MLETNTNTTIDGYIVTILWRDGQLDSITVPNANTYLRTLKEPYSYVLVRKIGSDQKPKLIKGAKI